jgi:serine/threonine-protein kinase
LIPEDGMPEPRDRLTEAAEDSASDLLDAALAIAFGPASGGPGEESSPSGEHAPALRLREAYPPDPHGRGADTDSSFELAGRYQVDGELARGGMGVILRGRDRDLAREVAIKVLREEHRGNAAMIRRFLEEAQISGQLQHPGVVPVYQLGRLADGRPYFSMRLVRGQTLAALLAARPEPSHDSMRFLVIFSQICQAVGYAHACGFTVPRDAGEVPALLRQVVPPCAGDYNTVGWFILEGVLHVVRG